MKPMFPDSAIETNIILTNSDSYFYFVLSNFMTNSLVYLHNGTDKVPVKILRDTGASEVFV